MSNRTRNALQLPDGCALLEAERHTWGVYVRYEGVSAEALRAAGCITEAMYQDLLAVKRGQSLCDAEGDRYYRQKKPTRALPGRLHITRYIDSGDAKALELPGVREMLACGSKDRRAGTPERRREIIFGRYVRPIRWTARGDVIHVDWQAVQAAAISSRFEPVGGAP